MALIRDPIEQLDQSNSFAKQQTLSRKEYVGNKALNVLVAIVTGVAVAIISTNGSLIGANDVSALPNFDTVPFIARNPALTVLMSILLAASLIPSFKKGAEIAWDGAVFAFSSIMGATLYILHRVDSSLAAEAAEVIPVVWGIAILGTIVYAFGLSFLFYDAFEKRSGWARLIVGTASLLYLAYIIFI